MNVPKLRFKGFEGEWEPKLFADLYTFKNGLNKEKEAFGRGTYILNYMDVNKNTVVTDSKIEGKVSLTETEIERFSVNSNDLFFTRTSESSEEIGLSCAYIGNDEKLVFSGFILRARPNVKNINSVFYAYYLRTFDKRKEIIKHSSITTRALTSGTLLSSIKIKHPSLEEQQKIADFFLCIDKKIQLQQEKIDLLQKQKKGFLQKMFPKAGETQPELRFKGFEEEWKISKVGDLMNVTSVKRIHQSDWREKGVRFLRARDIVSMFKNIEIEEHLYISQERYEEFSKISGKVEKGDLLVTGVGTIGVPLLIENDEALYFKDGNVIWFQNKNYVDGYFLYYSFINSNIQNFIHSVAGIGTVATYTIDNGRKTPICLPNHDEQYMIGNLLKQVDRRIILQQKKLKLLKLQKQGFMQQMFI